MRVRALCRCFVCRQSDAAADSCRHYISIFRRFHDALFGNDYAIHDALTQIRHGLKIAGTLGARDGTFVDTQAAALRKIREMRRRELRRVSRHARGEAAYAHERLPRYA